MTFSHPPSAAQDLGLLLHSKQTGLVSDLSGLDPCVWNPWKSGTKVPSMSLNTLVWLGTDPASVLLGSVSWVTPCWIFPLCGGKLNSLSEQGNPQNGLKPCSSKCNRHFAICSVHARACRCTQQLALQSSAQSSPGTAIRVYSTANFIWGEKKDPFAPLVLFFPSGLTSTLWEQQRLKTPQYNKPNLAVGVSLFTAGELDQITFKGAFQLKWFYNLLPCLFSAALS